MAVGFNKSTRSRGHVIIGVLLGLLVRSIDCFVDKSPYCLEVMSVMGADFVCDANEGYYADMYCAHTCSLASKPGLKCGTMPAMKRAGDEPVDKDDNDGNDFRTAFKRIVGGKQSSAGEYPWHVALRFRGDETEQQCQGAVISKGWIMTAAHCFDKDKTSTNPWDWQVVAGEHQLFVNDRTEEHREIKEIFIHDLNQRMRKDRTSNVYKNYLDRYDIALIRLNHDLPYTKFIQPVCLPTDGDAFKTDHKCNLVGWGPSKPGAERMGSLHHAKVKLVNNTVCQKKNYGPDHVDVKTPQVHEDHQCAGFNDKSVDACDYDGGGALVCNRFGRMYAQGLVSHNPRNCGVNRPPYRHTYGVYTNVPLMSNWIMKKMLAYADDGASLVNGGALPAR